MDYNEDIPGYTTATWKIGDSLCDLYYYAVEYGECKGGTTIKYVEPDRPQVNCEVIISDIVAVMRLISVLQERVKIYEDTGK